MKNLKMFSNSELAHQTEVAARLERRSQARLLALLGEVRARRLYAELGFQSLFAYLHEGLGYSESQAYERVRACELAASVPAVAEKIETGEMSLTVAAKLASHVRREGSDTTEAASLAERLTACSVRKAEQILVSESKNPAPPREVIKQKTTEFSLVSFGADTALVALIEEAKNLLGENSVAEVVKAGLSELVARKKRELGRAQGTPRVQSKTRFEPKNSGAPEPESPTEPSRYVPMQDRRVVAARSGGQCEFIEPKTKHRCSSRFGLELDHIQPFALGGETKAQNLRHYCRAHNTLAAVHVFGEAKMVAHKRS